MSEMNKHQDPADLKLTGLENTKMNINKIVIVIPTLNEEEAIGRVIDGIRGAMRSYQYEMVVVDGHSTDKTAEIAKRKDVVVIYQNGSGYGDAYIYGFEHATSKLEADVLVMIDGDGTYDPVDVPRLVEPVMNEEADLVVGDRFSGMHRGAMAFTNKVGNKVLSWMARRMIKVGIKDTQCGLRAFKAELLKKMDLTNEGMPFAMELLAEAKQANAKIVETPVSYRSRRGGSSKLSLGRDGLKILGTTLRLARDYQPLLFFGSIGAAFIGGGVILGLGVVIEWLKTGRITRLASTMLSAMLVISGLQIFITGLIADMIKRLRRKQ